MYASYILLCGGNLAKKSARGENMRNIRFCGCYVDQKGCYQNVPSNLLLRRFDGFIFKKNHPFQPKCYRAWLYFVISDCFIAKFYIVLPANWFIPTLETTHFSFAEIQNGKALQTLSLRFFFDEKDFISFYSV